MTNMERRGNATQGLPNNTATLAKGHILHMLANDPDVFRTSRFVAVFVRHFGWNSQCLTTWE